VSEFREFGRGGTETRTTTPPTVSFRATRPRKGQCGDDSFIARYHQARGLAVFVRNPSSENARLLFERVDPEIARSISRSRRLFTIPPGRSSTFLSRSTETGHGNESEYYLRGNRKNGCRSKPQRGLPNWRDGFRPGLGFGRESGRICATMQAEAGLYRPDDANCCPTGGIARIRLAIRSRQLVIDSVVIDKAQ